MRYYVWGLGAGGGGYVKNKKLPISLKPSRMLPNQLKWRDKWKKLWGGYPHKVSPRPLFAPLGPVIGENKFFQRGSRYTLMNADLHDDQLLLKALGKKISPSRDPNEKVPFF